MSFTLQGPLLLAGAGKMGGAILSGLLARGLKPERIIVQDPAPSAETAARLSKHGIRCVPTVDELAERPSIILLAVGDYLGRFNGKRAETIVTALNAMAEGDLTKKIDIQGRDEYAWMCWEYSCARKGFKEVVDTVISSATQLATAAEELSAITTQSSQGVATQQGEIQKIATAMEEMSATVREVANHAANAAKQAQEADSQSKQGQGVVNQTINTIHVLADEVKDASTVIETTSPVTWYENTELHKRVSLTMPLKFAESGR